jgi:hypothetical protein
MNAIKQGTRPVNPSKKVEFLARIVDVGIDIANVEILACYECLHQMSDARQRGVQPPGISGCIFNSYKVVVPKGDIHDHGQEEKVLSQAPLHWCTGQGHITASHPVQGPGKLMKRKRKHKVSDDDGEWTPHNR